MLMHTVLFHDDPVLRARLRAANEERAATIRASFKALFRFATAPLRLAAVPVRLAATAMVRAHRRSEAARQLAGLSDRALADIGVHRYEIRSLAEVAATLDPAVAMSVRDLRRMAEERAPRPAMSPASNAPAREAPTEIVGATGVDVAAVATRCREMTGRVAGRAGFPTPSGHPA